MSQNKFSFTDNSDVWIARIDRETGEIVEKQKLPTHVECVTEAQIPDSTRVIPWGITQMTFHFRLPHWLRWPAIWKRKS